MLSYSITYSQDNLGNDLLKVAFSKTLNQGNIIVEDAKEELNKLIKSQQLKGGKLIKIDGKQSYLVSYTIAHEICHLYETIAVSNPKLGGYIVVISSNKNYPLGSIIENETNEIIAPPQATESLNIPSFFIDFQGDILKAQLNCVAKVKATQIVLDTQKQLQQMKNNQQFSGGKLLLINGRATIFAGYVIAMNLAHKYGAIAVFDPKIGEKGLDKYVVTISHSPEYQVGEIIDKPNNNNSDAKIVICGSKNTGKTVLSQGLINALHHLENAPDSYMISGCPDGEGSWFNETYKNYPEIAKNLKEEYKDNFTPEFAHQKAKEIEYNKIPILIFDVGGKLQKNGDLTPENQLIMSKATHSIIVAKNQEEIDTWKKGCQDLNLPVVAIIKSNLNTEDDIINNEKDFFEGTIHKLKRGIDISPRPFVKKLAKYLVNLVTFS